jgi:hypothetical protein
MNMRRDMTNRKPFRNRAQREALKAPGAVWKTKQGHYRSDAPVSFHRHVTRPQ